jgi:protein SCO1/2
MRPRGLRPVRSRASGRTVVPSIAIVVLSLFLVASCAQNVVAEELPSEDIPAAQTPVGLAGMVRSPLANVAHVVLPAASDGDADFAMVAADGELLVAYFGYLSCPDVCPTTMADLRRAITDLGTDASQVRVAFVTIDPDRDQPNFVTSYIQRFFDDGIALRTDDPAALRSAADAFGAGYEVTEGADGVIDVTHSSFLYAIDSEGTIQVQWPFGMTSGDIAHDLAYLLEEQS